MPAEAFSGEGTTHQPGRWTRRASDIRGVYVSESLALACLETLVHIRPLPRQFRPSVFYTIELPDGDIERADVSTLPAGWNDPQPPVLAQDFGTAFLREQRAVALIVPTAVVPVGWNAIVNPLHPRFRLDRVEGPFPFVYDGRLA